MQLTPLVDPFFLSEQMGESAEIMKKYRWFQNLGLGNAEHLFIKVVLLQFLIEKIRTLH